MILFKAFDTFMLIFVQFFSIEHLYPIRDVKYSLILTGSGLRKHDKVMNWLNIARSPFYLSVVIKYKVLTFNNKFQWYWLTAESPHE